MTTNQNEQKPSASPNSTNAPNAQKDPTITPKRITRKISGFLPVLCGIMLVAAIPLFVVGAIMLDSGNPDGGEMMLLSAADLVASILLIASIKSVKPNEAAVYTLFGNYYGTIQEPGLYLLNPFASSVGDPSRKQVKMKNNNETDGQTVDFSVSHGRLSLKVKTLNNERQKVNDLLGNPVILETVVFWRIVDPTKAVFNVDN